MTNKANLGSKAKVAPQGAPSKPRKRKVLEMANFETTTEPVGLDVGVDADLPPGFSLLKKVYTEVSRDGTKNVVGHDLVLSCEMNGAVWFCGTTGNWKPKSSQVFDAFSDVITPNSRVEARDHATASAWAIYRRWQEKASSADKEFEIHSVDVPVHLAVNLESLPKTARQVQWRTSLEETHKLNSMFLALQQLGATVNGGPVKSYVDVVRWVFSQIGE